MAGAIPSANDSSRTLLPTTRVVYMRRWVMSFAAILSSTRSLRLIVLPSVSAFRTPSGTTAAGHRRYLPPALLSFNSLLSFHDQKSSCRTTIGGCLHLSSCSSSTTTEYESSFTEEDVDGATRKTPAKFVHFPFDYHELVDIRVETLTNRGWGIGRVDMSLRNEPQQQEQSLQGVQLLVGGDNLESGAADNETTVSSSSIASSTPQMKWVVMVPNVIPGELVRVRIFRNFKNYSEGDLVSVLEPSLADRVEPACALAQDCGGCQLQHMSVTSQRRWKTVVVQESLQQYGIILDAAVAPTLGTDEILGYRSKLTPHYDAPVSAKQRRRRRSGPTSNAADAEGDRNSNSSDDNSIRAIGFQRQTSRSILDVTHCPIATPAVNDKYEQVRTELLSQPSTRTKGATLLFRQANLDDTGGSAVSTNHQDYLTTRVRDLDFTYQAGNFFQNNYYVLPLMVDHVVDASSASATAATTTGGDDGATIIPSKMTHLVDCYCGSGLFALSAAAHFETVVGIEINNKAVIEATANAVANGIANCQFRAATAEAIFADISHFPRDKSVVVLDPPRKGCSPDFLAQLYAFQPQRIVYMSCDPTTQARDAQDIVGTGCYRITSVQPFDLFPQTRHIECLIIFERTD